MKALAVLSQICGYLYFLIWSGSFYPQIFTIYKQKDASGLSIDYNTISFFGYIFYSFYNSVGVVDPTIGTGNIQVQDLLFTWTALFSNGIMVSQTLIYPLGGQKLSKWVIILSSIMFGIFIVLFIIESAQVFQGNIYFNLTMMCGYFKVIITFVQYLPQMHLNYKRKSTYGFNIFLIWLDLAGSLASLLQNLLDTIASGHNQFFNSDSAFNLAKFSLAISTIFCDLVLIFQHYCLYFGRMPVNVPRALTDQYSYEVSEETDRSKGTPDIKIRKLD